MRVFHHMRELEEALKDWERYRRIPEEQFLQDRDTQLWFTMPCCYPFSRQSI